MNIVDFWKELVADWQSYKDFISNEEFIEKLNENVPEWKQEVKDENLWPELHSYSGNVAESYVRVIIDEAGLDFAYYLIKNQWGKLHLDASRALDYCCEHINEWNSFPNDIKEKVLEHELIVFLNECQQNESVWQSLTETQKGIVFDGLATEEYKYVSDILLFKLWSEELNYKESPYVIFETDIFRHVYEESIHQMGAEESRVRMLESRLRNWNMPEIIVENEQILSYIPSRKLQQIKDIAESYNDQLSIAIIDNVVCKIKNRLR